MLAQLFHAQRYQVAGEKLGQRTGYAFGERARADQIQIFVADKAGRWENSFRALHLRAVKARCFRELDPAEDAAVRLLVTSFTGAIMVDNALAPGAPEHGVRGA